ncbi:hypothetical protein [Serratia sp. (in: enterobacteria)]|uniref:hypothetical protein n=1 Tax=Serratia sp. (in: enterobacteria) TaxID=616 RepID=UPI003988CEDD
MEEIPEQIAKNKFDDLLIKVHNLQAALAESIAQADRGELLNIDEVFAPLTADELNVSEG